MWPCSSDAVDVVLVILGLALRPVGELRMAERGKEKGWICAMVEGCGCEESGPRLVCHVGGRRQKVQYNPEHPLTVRTSPRRW